jgi:hypothetical protein
VLAVEVPVLEVDQLGVALDVALRREALPAQLAVVLHIGMHCPATYFLLIKEICN